VITEIFKSKGIALRSPTINKGYLSAIARLLEEIRGLGFKEKKAAAFGSYGWNGEAVKLICESLKDSGWQVVNEGLRIQWKPDDAGINQSIEFGKQAANQLD
jgi:anaerobic nitric oxide reductase flavorubredoxin